MGRKREEMRKAEAAHKPSSMVNKMYIWLLDTGPFCLGEEIEWVMTDFDTSTSQWFSLLTAAAKWDHEKKEWQYKDFRVPLKMHERAFARVGTPAALEATVQAKLKAETEEENDKSKKGLALPIEKREA